MDGILEALAFALLIGGQFLAVIVTSISKATPADAEERRQGTALPDGPETRGINCAVPFHWLVSARSLSA